MMTMTKTETHAEILAKLADYVLGGFSFAHIRTLGEITALSVDFVRHPHAVYRIATMANGDRVLACRYRAPGRKFSPVSR